MKQQTLANNDFEQFRKSTRRDKFLAEMNTVVPWPDLVAVIEPYYPKASCAGGRPPVGLERMLRIHCLQLWFDLSDPAVEEALYDSRAMRSFVGIDLGREPVPDETTVMRFRHLLEEHKLGAKFFEEPNVDTKRLLKELDELSFLAVNIDSDNPAAWRVRAESLIRERRWDAALEA